MFHRTNKLGSIRTPLHAILVAFCVLLVPDLVFSQVQPEFPTVKPEIRPTRDPADGVTIGEMVVKQQITRRRKEHDELIKRGEEALKLSEDLETSIAGKETLGSQDLEKLQSLEKVVSRIRKDLGGDDEDDIEDSSSKENSARQSIGAALRFLKDSTRTLVDELKRTSRFSISAIAIQTSNSVIRFARFLRLRK
jgi:hypothetical protein